MWRWDWKRRLNENNLQLLKCNYSTFLHGWIIKLFNHEGSSEKAKLHNHGSRFYSNWLEFLLTPCPLRQLTICWTTIKPCVSLYYHTGVVRPSDGLTMTFWDGKLTVTDWQSLVILPPLVILSIATSPVRKHIKSFCILTHCRISNQLWITRKWMHHTFVPMCCTCALYCTHAMFLCNSRGSVTLLSV